MKLNKIIAMLLFSLFMSNSSQAIELATGLLRGLKETLQDGKSFIDRHSNLESEKKFSQMIHGDENKIIGHVVLNKKGTLGTVEAVELQKNGDTLYHVFKTSIFPHLDQDGIMASISKKDGFYSVDRHFVIKDKGIPANEIAFEEKFSAFVNGDKTYKRIESLRYQNNKETMTLVNKNTSVDISYNIQGQSFGIQILKSKIDTGDIQILSVVYNPLSSLKDGFSIRYLKNGKIYDKYFAASVLEKDKKYTAALTHEGAARQLNPEEIKNAGLLATEKVIHARRATPGNVPELPLSTGAATK